MLRASCLGEVLKSSPEQAAPLLGATTPAQAAAFQRYIVLTCVVLKRRRRGIPHERETAMAQGLLRCMAPGLRNRLPDHLRYAFT